MKKKEQIINPLIRFRGKAQGRYANRTGARTYARATTADEIACFFVVSAEIGNPNPEETLVCFNVPPDETTCGVSGQPGFEFRVDDSIFGVTQSYIDAPSTNCLRFQTRRVVEGDGISPNDSVTMFYQQGTCHKSGDSDPDCVLENITDYQVTNSILGVSFARVGDLADNLVIVGLTSPTAVIGNNWVIAVNSTGRTITNSEIVNGNIRFTIDVNVNPGDTVQISHTGITNGAQATDGRLLYQFHLEPVENATGIDYWILENTEAPRAWVTESVGRWKLG